MHTDPRPDDTLVDLRSLVMWFLEHLETLVEGYLAELETIAGYSEVEIPESDLRETTGDALELILRMSADLPVPARLTTLSETIGRRRASQGVPLEILLQAVRMVFRLLWKTLHAQATATQRAALDRSAVQVWEAIEFHTIRVHAGYLDESARMRRDRETELAILISDFLESDRPTAALLLQVSRTLGLGLDEPLLVAAAPLQSLVAIQRDVSSHDDHVQAHPRSDSVMLLMPSTLDRNLREYLGGVSFAVAPLATNLSGLPRAWRIAHDLLLMAPPPSGQVQTLREGWLDMLPTLIPDLTSAIVEEATEAMSSMTPAAGSQLRSTVEAYMKTGSLLETSKLMFCHRNTVLKRLSKFREATGLDPTVPWDAATIRLLLASVDPETSDPHP